MRVASARRRKLCLPGNKSLWFVMTGLALWLFQLQGRVLLLEVHSDNDDKATQQVQQHQHQHVLASPSFLIAKNSTTNSQKSKSNKLVYVGSFGLGHRLSKLSAAYHLAGCLNLPLVEVQWGSCSATENNDDGIFAGLFGHNSLTTLRTPLCNNNSSLQRQQAKVILVRNDVSGYYAAQSYKNSGIPLEYARAVAVYSDKLQSDHDLFTELFDRRFAMRSTVEQFQHETGWSDHTVIGVHVRAGNGEQDHFVRANRAILRNKDSNNNYENVNSQKSSTTFVAVESMAQLVHQLWKAMQDEHVNLKPPLVFIATDTVSYLSAFRRALQHFQRYTVIAWEQQPRVEPGQGVSYQTWSQGHGACLDGWRAAAIDMTLLSRSDVLIATTRSTFTQIAPASLVFGRQRRQPPSHHRRYAWCYCEMELQVATTTVQNNSSMTCFQTQAAWLLRRPTTALRTFSLQQSGEAALAEKTATAVTHKVMVHLPDIAGDVSDPIFAVAQDFLRSSALVMSNETIFYYGRKYNPKYRGKSPFRKDWTWRQE